MSHPTNEEWGLYLFNEAPPELHRKLKSHLNQCPSCAAEVRAMQQTITRLDEWKVAPTPRRTIPLQPPVLRWAIAALIVMGIGIGFGRLIAPQPVNAEQLRSEIKASLLADLQNALDQVSSDCNALVAAAEVRWADQTHVSLQTLGRELMDTVNAGRVQDQRAIQAVLEQLKQQREADYVSLRRDLETVASAADQQLQQARLTLFELAANSTPGN